MSEYQLRVPCNLVEPLLEAIKPTRYRESVVFGLASHARIPAGTLLLLRRVIPVPAEAYLPSAQHGAKWSGRFTLQILNEALRERLGVVIFHAHDFPVPAALSRDDLASARELLDRFAIVEPERPHASVVVASDSAAAVVHDGGRIVRPSSFSLRFLGGSIKDLADRPTAASESSLEPFDRQVLAIGSAGQERLFRATVSVIGLGGGGSHVVQQLAHLGVGTIVGIDADLADEPNRSRTIGLAPADVHRPKTEVMADLVRRVGLGSTFVGVRAHVPAPEAVEAIKQADVIVGCVDNYHARADLQELAWRFLVPYVDVGLLIEPRLRAKNPEHWIGGNVFTLIPGSHCMWCLDFLNDSKLSRETEGRGRSYFKIVGGQAQVVSFNGLLASHAVSEVLQLLTGFADRLGATVLRKFNGPLGTLESWRINVPSRCQRCTEHVAAGDAVWTPVPSSSEGPLSKSSV